ncbi:nitrophenyl compound nitroreductase subunit ArsF family protein [uncultured Bacteroides sp.]|uniref:nitrophenyl compound nitroreductase subunit ArsF family protein n=1 Tax=uncultured Bacteroides sp. TaxID=162156 RepID=UPI0026162B47|nr:nitrophenyl compound nitroreductase subunit ArsF family protein [uncultured Bacteroides sp.]
MKNFFYLLIVSILFLSCGKGSENKTEARAANETQPDRVEVLYFYGAQRCITCRAIEAHTVALLDSLYAKEQAEGKVVYTVIDLSKKGNESLADQYEVTWSSLFVNRWKDGEEHVNNLTEFSFSHAKNEPDQFKEGLKNKIDELLKEL